MSCLGSPCLAFNSKMAPSIFFLIAMGANYSFEVKKIEIWEPAFFELNNSFVATLPPHPRVSNMGFHTSLLLVRNYSEPLWFVFNSIELKLHHIH